MPPLLADGRAPRLAALVANGVGQATALVATAFLIQAAVADLGEAGATLVPAAGVAAMGAGIAALRARERHDAERLGQAYVTSTRQHLLAALLRRPPEERLDDRAVLRLSGDLPAVKRWVSHGMARSIAAGMMLAGIVSALAMMDPLLGALGAALVATAVALEFWLTVPLTGAIRKSRRRQGRVARLVIDQLRGGTADLERASRRMGSAAAAMVARMRVVGRMEGLPDAAGGLLVAAVLAVAALRVPPPDAAAIAGAVFLGGLAALPLRRLAQAMHAWVSYREARRRIAEITVDRDQPRQEGPSQMRRFAGARHREAAGP